MKKSLYALAAVGLTAFASIPATADEASDLAKQLSNPISSLISVPFQGNFAYGIGPDEDGSQFLLNVQPVVPISISEDWNMISRTIVPIISQSDIYPGSGTQFGLGDTTESLFFSPKKVGPSGVIWGVGPVFLLPTATDDLLGADTWGAGATFVVLKQQKGWTYGMLANQIWSIGDPEVPISSAFLQPFVSYTTPTAWSYTLNTESTYDWVSDQWTVPINAMVTKLVKFGKQPVSIGGGIKYYAESPEGGPQGWGARLIVTLLFPKK